MFQDDLGSIFDIILLLFLLSSCLCLPIARSIQERQRQRMARQIQQARENQARSGSMQDTWGQGQGPAPVPRAVDERTLQRWEENLLTAKDQRQKLTAIAQLGKYGTHNTLDMLSEYAEVDRNPEILAAIEGAMEQIENRLAPGAPKDPDDDHDEGSVTFTN